MKKLFCLLPLLAMLFLVSCSDDENDNIAKKYTVDVTVTLPTDISMADVTELVITAVNTQTSEESVANPVDGKASFTLNAGEYDFRASGSAKDYNLNGLVSKVSVYSDQSVSLPLAIASGSGLIFKEVYFTGVKDWYFKDAFYEIYNNSDEVQYLDGVILGIVDNGLPVNVYVPSPSIWVDENGELLDRYPMASFTVAFPGTGKEHPLQPGESVVVATNPIKHNERQLTGDDVASPVDLSTADWDIYCGPFSSTDTDINGIPNMDCLYLNASFGMDFMPSVDGQALILAKLPEGMTNVTFVADPENMMVAPGKSDKAQLMIPREYVIDGIDIVPAIESDRYKHLKSTEDVGMAWVDGSSNGSLASSAYSGKSLRRKVIAINNGRVVYKDTNNSSEDFILGGQTPTPGPHPTGVDK